MRIKFTTYDTRRDEDIIHLDTDQSNIMKRNRDYSPANSSHPFIYGKVIAILHADVGLVGDIGRRGPQYFHRRMEILWVRWYKLLPRQDLELGALTLDEVELIPIDKPGSHSFIDPEDVTRACHIVPNFQMGKRYPEGVGKSVVADDGKDYERYFVNRQVVFSPKLQ